MRKSFVALFGLLVATAPAAAQDETKVDFSAGFGGVIAVGDFADSVNDGLHGTFATTFNISPTLGVQGEYM